MDGKRLIHGLRLRNILSYGPDTIETVLEPLNVLIGPNGSGKSNLVEAISLLQAAPRDLAECIRRGGGASEWLWKGSADVPIAEVEAVIDNPHGSQPLRHRLQFTAVNQRFEIVDESIENEHAYPPHDTPYFHYRYQHGNPILRARVQPDDTDLERRVREMRREDLSPEASVLSQRRDPDQLPELTYLGDQYRAIRIFEEWHLGRRSEARRPQSPDLPEDFLEESARNLPLVLNYLQHQPGVKRRITERLKAFYPRVEDITTRVSGGTIQVYIHERGLREPMPATRLSDGTLRFLCLVCVLCHPAPPPLICIEEPELGLRSDVMPELADLLKDAAQRTQVIVTTHSEHLVRALSDVPEAVVVVERTEGGTSLRRLDPEPLAEWLERYSLGDLWAMGEIGGNT